MRFHRCSIGGRCYPSGGDSVHADGADNVRQTCRCASRRLNSLLCLFCFGSAGRRAATRHQRLERAQVCCFFCRYVVSMLTNHHSRRRMQRSIVECREQAPRHDGARVCSRTGTVSKRHAGATHNRKRRHASILSVRRSTIATSRRRAMPTSRVRAATLRPRSCV